MAEFLGTVKKSRHGVFYVDIPEQIMMSINLKPFMAGKMKIEEGTIRLYDFQKTRKIRVNLKEETLAILRRIMKFEGYGSLDETISNIVERHYAKMKGKRLEEHTVYIYPVGFLNSGFDLISDYEKAMRMMVKGKKKKIKN